jgi:hypothetical protein
MIHLVHQLMKRGKGLSIFAGVVEGAFEVRHGELETRADRWGSRDGSGGAPHHTTPTDLLKIIAF